MCSLEKEAGGGGNQLLGIIAIKDLESPFWPPFCPKTFVPLSYIHPSWKAECSPVCKHHQDCEGGTLEVHSEGLWLQWKDGMPIQWLANLPYAFLRGIDSLGSGCQIWGFNLGMFSPLTTPKPSSKHILKSFLYQVTLLYGDIIFLFNVTNSNTFCCGYILFSFCFMKVHFT